MTHCNKSEHLAASLYHLSDGDLLRQIESLARDESDTTIKILHHLNEIERRKLHLDLGYGSMFDYCTRCLEYSPSAAGRRIQAARCVRRYPPVLELLEKRELTVCGASLIAPILTVDNFREILERVRGASHRDIEGIVAERRPPVAFQDRVQPVRVATTERDKNVVTPGAGSASARIEEKLLVQFLAGKELMANLDEVKALLSNRGEWLSLGDVFEILVAEFLERHSPAARQARRKANKRAASPDSRRRELTDANPSRHIPAEVRDEVYIRDGGKCAFVAANGTRCGSRHGLEVDHVVPYSAGGTNDLSNLRLLCAAHNLRAAEQRLGAHVMAPYWRRQ